VGELKMISFKSLNEFFVLIDYLFLNFIFTNEYNSETNPPKLHFFQNAALWLSTQRRLFEEKKRKKIIVLVT